jgi:nucleotide-binding universal stress UspA family protein
MFKHILLPTDGSVLSETAIKKGVAFAKEINAKVSGLTVTKPFHVFTTDVMELEDTKGTYPEDTKALADKRLSVIEQAAKQAGSATTGSTRSVTIHGRKLSKPRRTEAAT